MTITIEMTEIACDEQPLWPLKNYTKKKWRCSSTNITYYKNSSKLRKTLPYPLSIGKPAHGQTRCLHWHVFPHMNTDREINPSIQHRATLHTKTDQTPHSLLSSTTRLDTSHWIGRFSRKRIFPVLLPINKKQAAENSMHSFIIIFFLLKIADSELAVGNLNIYPKNIAQPYTSKAELPRGKSEPPFGGGRYHVCAAGKIYTAL